MQAKTALQKMKNILTNKSLSLNIRKRELRCCIEPILLYGCKAWTINKHTLKSLEATEMWFLRRMLRVPWMAKRTNTDVLEKAQEKRCLLTKIRKRQSTFIGHIMRRGKIENIITTGKLNGEKGRGRRF